MGQESSIPIKSSREPRLAALHQEQRLPSVRGHDKGTLEPGKLADLIVVDRDPLTSADDQLAGTRVLRTIIGGKTVYKAPEHE